MKQNVAQETSGFAGRIRALRRVSQLSVAEFASELDCDRSYIYRLESGGSANPSNEFITKLISRFRANEAWLLKGEGPMMHATHQVSQEATRLDMLIDASLGKLLSGLKTTELREALAFFMQFEGKFETHSICTEITIAILSELRRRALTKTL